MRRLEIKSFFYAQTSMEIFRGGLVGLFSIRTDVSHFDIKLSTQPEETLFSTFFPGLVCIQHAYDSLARTEKTCNQLLL